MESNDVVNKHMSDLNSRSFQNRRDKVPFCQANHDNYDGVVFRSQR